jgi:glycosyltransferase involved in cell wall biosynthesis
MKIAVVSDEHFPHTGADTEVIVNTAAALGARGADVTLVVPWLPGRRDRVEEICTFYGVPGTFRVDAVAGWPWPSRELRLETLVHGLAAALSPSLRCADVVHSRDLMPLVVTQLAGIPWSFETYRRHSEEKPWLPRLSRVARLDRAVGASAHTDASRLDLIRLGFPEDAVVTARPGFAVDRFATPLSREEARRRIGVTEQGGVVAYVGNIHASKGLEQLLALAGRLPEVTFVVVGGNAAEVSELTVHRDALGLRNVNLVGHRRPADVAPYLFAADALFAPYLQSNVRTGWLAERLAPKVLPGTPLKLYAYLASGRPIVAADQATNRELLRHEENALLFPPERLDLAAESIRRLLGDRVLAERLSARGLSFVKTCTWDERAKIMLAFFERRLSARAG